MEAQSTENTFAAFLSTCGACKGNLEGKDPKILPCLHTFCKQCILSECVAPDKATTLRCTTCKQECHPTACVENHFCMNSPSPPSRGASSVEDTKACTGCEESSSATSYCMECTEWLCDQCVQAHRRVRITKDHSILPKDNVPSSDATGAPEQYSHCPTHKTELLKLFCETCERLTCRDCQLQNHKDHRYSYINEASTHYKQFLTTLVGKLKEKQTYVENAKALINRRYSEIDKKEKAVAQEVKTFAVKLITEINRRGKKLLTDLNSVCGAKMRQLGIKHNEILVLAMRLSHALKFAEYALEHSSGSAVLHSKKVLVNQLKTVLRTRCEVPNPYHVVDIRLKYELNGITNALAQQGTLLVDGVPYNGPSVGTSGHPSLRNPSPQSPGSSRMAPNFSNLSPDQRAALMHRLAKMAQQQGKTLPTLPSVSGQGSSSHGFRQAPQSSMVSSSNHKAAGYYGRSSGSLPHPNMINLAQLQQKRRMQHALQAATHTSAATNSSAEQTPIVIQPTDSPTDQHYNLSAGSEVCPIEISPSPTSSSSLVSANESPHPSSSSLRVDNENLVIGSIAPVKEEAIQEPSVSLLEMAKELNFDADPESFLVGIKKEVDSRQPPREVTPEAQTSSPDNSLLVASGGEEALLQLLDPVLSEDSSVSDKDPVAPLLQEILNAEAMQSTSTSSTAVSTTPSTPTAGGGKIVNSPRKLTSSQSDDPNEDWCSCCHNGGEMICCDLCPKVFHLQCHVPTLHIFPTGTWQCNLCRKDEEYRLEKADPRPEEIPVAGSKRKQPLGLTDKELKVCERIMLEIFCHEASVPFHEPVPKSVPNYYKIILNPMDFTTMKSKLCRQHFNHYRSVEAFASDMLLIFKNCFLYNAAGSEVAEHGRLVLDFFRHIMERFLPYVDINPIQASLDASEKSLNAKRKKKEEATSSIGDLQENGGPVPKKKKREDGRASPSVSGRTDTPPPKRKRKETPPPPPLVPASVTTVEEGESGKADAEEKEKDEKEDKDREQQKEKDDVKEKENDNIVDMDTSDGKPDSIVLNDESMACGEETGVSEDFPEAKLDSSDEPLLPPAEDAAPSCAPSEELNDGKD